MTMIITVLLIIASVLLDQITKYLVVAHMSVGQSIDVIPGIFRFTYIHNYGAAFGSMANARWIFMIFSIIGIVAIFVYLVRKKPQSKLLRSALILVAGGGIGNMIDRIWLGYVVDFIDFCAFPKIWMWIFNVADACVCIGAGILILWMILDIIKDEKMKKLATANEDRQSNETQNADYQAGEDTTGVASENGIGNAVESAAKKDGSEDDGDENA